MGFVFQPQDADTVLADFGLALVCPAAPHVTRCLVDRAIGARPLGDIDVQAQLTVLKVKAGAFGTMNMKNKRVSVIDREGVQHEYAIENPLEQGPDIFDWYALQDFRPRTP